MTEILLSFSSRTLPILDTAISLDRYVPIDLSTTNDALDHFAVTDPDDCQAYIDRVLRTGNGQVAFGGYLERRNIYADKVGFKDSGASPRNIHLGVDFWAPAGTEVLVPLAGRVHSFQNNTTIGDYGPTIVLEHELEGIRFCSLYGHLSVASLDELYIGKEFGQNQVLATLGTSDINVHYAPHLHFQLILDMEGKKRGLPRGLYP